MRLMFLAAMVAAFVAIGCADDEEEDPTNLPLIASPVGNVIRKDCESIAVTDYFLSDEESDWFKENCNRLDCDLIRGTEYLSDVERTWYLDECT